MEQAASNKNTYLALAVIVLSVLVWLSITSSPKSHVLPNDPHVVSTTVSETRKPADPPKQTGDVPVDSPSNVMIGKAGFARKINAIFTTRKKAVVYQALVKYEPVDVPSDEVPGIKEILQYYGRQGRELPRTLKRVDQEMEMSSENLGVPLRFVASTKLYVNPDGGKVVAYDMAQTTGGQPQRMVGHLNKTGMAIEVYRGGTLDDKQEITFVRDTFIPVEYSFIHQWYETPENREALKKREQVKFSIFVPESMAQVLLLVKPMDDQVIAVGDATYDCAHYEVITVSTQSASGLSAKQEMWFDKQTRVLMRRQDFDASMADAEAPVTDLEPYSRIEQLGRLSLLPVSAPATPNHGIDYLLDQDLDYTVKARGEPIGEVRVQFSKFEIGGKVPPFMPSKLSVKPTYFSTSRVRVDTGGSLRNEIAVTLYDAKWKVIHYETHGEENTGVKLNYDIEAKIENETIRVHTHRDALLELKASAAYQGAIASAEVGSQFTGGDDDRAWRDPLKRVPVSDDDAKSQESDTGPRMLDHSWSRPFPDEIYISDFNRVEHLALVAAQISIPPLPEKETDPVKLAYQKIALYLVRQNRCGVLLIETRPEPKPILTERQKKRRTNDELKEPPLYVANVTAAMMPCRMLLSGDGRVLELSMQYGSGDVTYTLDDPIMRHRDEAAKKRQLQEGPRLVRPPWW